MKPEDKIAYFDENLETILFNDAIGFKSLLKDFITNESIRKTFVNWPDEIKTKIVDYYFIELDENNYSDIGMQSWDEFYEMYDGKFDEDHMLHLTLDAKFQLEIEDLGYTKQNTHDDWHKPLAGEYKKDNNGNLVIIHSCPDREIFEVKASQYLEEIGIKQDWVIEATFSVM